LIKPEFLILRFGELWLKGANRKDFVRALARRLRAGLKVVAPTAELVVRHDRMEIRLGDEEPDAALALARRTPGLARVICAVAVARDLEAMKTLAPQLVAQARRKLTLAGEGETPSFRVASRRSDKRFELRSPDLNRVLAEAVLSEHQLPVDLRRAQLTLGCEVAPHGCALWTDDYEGCGGLPVGSAGKTLLMLSGGIDSPVAGHLAQRRGCELEAIYFHSPPFVPEETRDKVRELGAILAAAQGGLILHSVYFTAIQKAIKAHCEAKHTVLLYRRFMYRITDRIAEQRRCLALVTGENLGQVASQTIENLNLVDRLTERIVFRPLLTYDKRHVMDAARALGTYEISIRPFDDCCTLFIPKNPTTRGRLRIIEAQERRLDVEALVAEAIERTERFDLAPAQG
jgi:thiamine biosynthesis protein ThiI